MTNFADSSQLPILVVFDGTQPAVHADTSQLPVLMVFDAGPPANNAKTSQQPTLAVYNTGGREDLRVRAWTFSLDGNWYYVLHLGAQGTWVYCIATDTWTQWQTDGFPNWNAEQGVVWNGRIVAGDNENSTLWEIRADLQIDDDFRPIYHVETAFLPESARSRTTVPGLWVTASMGEGYAGADSAFNLRFSDDYGKTWTVMPAIAVTIGDFKQEIAWRSLGSFMAPGRVFELSDYGGPRRIDRASTHVPGSEA